MSPKPIRGRRLKDYKPFKNSNLTGRTIGAPIIALVMGSLFYVYACSSVYAAKWNAKRHREADGGQISWRNESRRRHGVLRSPDDSFKINNYLKGPQEHGCETEGRATQMSKEEEVVRSKAARKNFHN